MCLTNFSSFFQTNKIKIRGDPRWKLTTQKLAFVIAAVVVIIECEISKKDKGQFVAFGCLTVTSSWRTTPDRWPWHSSNNWRGLMLWRRQWWRFALATISSWRLLIWRNITCIEECINNRATVIEIGRLVAITTCFERYRTRYSLRPFCSNSGTLKTYVTTVP